MTVTGVCLGQQVTPSNRPAIDRALPVVVNLGLRRISATPAITIGWQAEWKNLLKFCHANDLVIEPMLPCGYGKDTRSTSSQIGIWRQAVSDLTFEYFLSSGWSDDKARARIKYRQNSEPSYGNGGGCQLSPVTAPPDLIENQVDHYFFERYPAWDTVNGKPVDYHGCAVSSATLALPRPGRDNAGRTLEVESFKNPLPHVVHGNAYGKNEFRDKNGVPYLPTVVETVDELEQDCGKRIACLKGTPIHTGTLNWGEIGFALLKILLSNPSAAIAFQAAQYQMLMERFYHPAPDSPFLHSDTANLFSLLASPDNTGARAKHIVENDGRLRLKLVKVGG